jgi:ketosteroid isomerase-like protein
MTMPELALLLATATPATPQPPAANESAIRHEIDATVARLETAIESGMTAKELTRIMYQPDAIVTGEGVPKARYGITAETVAIDGFLKSLARPGHRGCKFAFVEPLTIANDAVSAFVNLSCRPASFDQPGHSADMMRYHVLYVWKKRPSETWKVSLELFGPGFI